MTEKTRYARKGDVNSAYQDDDAGPRDLVFVMGSTSHLDKEWEEHRFVRFLHRLSSFARVILFDQRGNGLSDAVTLEAFPTLEQRLEDLRAVIDAAGSEKATLFGVSSACPLSTIFAATHPERTESLILYGGYARRV